jgi:hypothetical protein
MCVIFDGLHIDCLVVKSSIVSHERDNFSLFWHDRNSNLDLMLWVSMNHGSISIRNVRLLGFSWEKDSRKVATYRSVKHHRAYDRLNPTKCHQMNGLPEGFQFFVNDHITPIFGPLSDLHRTQIGKSNRKQISMPRRRSSTAKVPLIFMDRNAMNKALYLQYSTNLSFVFLSLRSHQATRDRTWIHPSGFASSDDQWHFEGFQTVILNRAFLSWMDRPR